jgi:hypothetical protein
MKARIKFFKLSDNNDIHEEVKQVHREYLESRLAQEVLQKANIFQSIKKISNNMLTLLEHNHSTVLQLIMSNPKIQDELLNKIYFGHLNLVVLEQTDNVEKAEQLLALIKQTLIDVDTDLTKVMQIHGVFIYRIYLMLPNKNLPNDEVDTFTKYFDALKFFPDNLFDQSMRGRVTLDMEVAPSTKLGISRHGTRSKMLCDGNSHLRAIDRFFINQNSSFYSVAVKAGMPVVSGLSSHTKSFLLGALTYGCFTNDELLEYVFVCAAFLIAGGNHSFHEVMSVARYAGIPYKDGSYAECIPTVFKDICEDSHLNHQFPEAFESIKLSFNRHEGSRLCA